MVKITRMLHHLIANNRSQSPRRSKCSELLLSCHDERAAATRSAVQMFADLRFRERLLTTLSAASRADLGIFFFLSGGKA